MSTPLPHDHIIPFKDSRKTKKQQVAQMFDEISGNYDKMNRFLSARTDLRWRKKAILQLKNDRPKKMLDVATGTADLAIMAAKMLKPDQIIGIDISEGMLKIGRKKIEKEHLGSIIQLQDGDSETINHRENTFDAVTVAFGVRNFENLENGLAEMFRVLKPGGKLIVIEFSKPQIAIVKGFYKLYMGIVAPRVASWFKQNKDAYHYLNKSASAFPDRELFTAILKKMGYVNAQFTSLSLGICCIYSGQKPL